MKSPFRILVRLLLLWLFTFALGKVGFMLICHGREYVTFADSLRVLWHGLPMDLSMSSYLLLFPWLCLSLCLFWPQRFIRPVLQTYHLLVSLAVVICIIVDIGLYPFWGFKLDATIFNYIDSPADALASVSTGFILLHVLFILCLSALLTWAGWRLMVPAGTSSSFVSPSLRGWVSGWCYTLRAVQVVLCALVLFLLLRGGVTESTMNVGNAYFSQRQFLNHSAVNPVFSLLSSASKSERFSTFYDYLPDDEADVLFAELQLPASSAPSAADSSSKVLPSTILLIIWEGCGGQLTAPLGGRDDVTPNLNRLAHEGLFFSQLRANSFRTDRGLISILSGHVSYPTHSLMKMATKASRLPSIARTLHRAGYENTFIYGGDIDFTNMKGYLIGTGYDHIIADSDFSLSERNSSEWGANDSILFDRLWDELSVVSPSPRFVTTLTLSSHEPWDVPSRRLADDKLNAFAYTDAQLGRFMQRLKASPLWEDALVIILPDHGVLAGSVDRCQDPAFFRIPMVWTGGALSSLSFRGEAMGTGPDTFDCLMSQSDLAATLLSCLGLPHDDFPWSRDVTSPAYGNYPFTYSTFVDGFAFTDSTGTTVFDNISQMAIIHTTPDGSTKRLRQGQAIQQKSYDLLEQL